MANKPKRHTDPRALAQRALIVALKRAEQADDTAAVVTTARAILAEFEEPPKPRDQSRSRAPRPAAHRGTRRADARDRGGSRGETSGVDVSWHALASVRGWVYLRGCGLVSTDDLIFILVNHRSEVLRAAHAAHAAADRLPISALRDAPAAPPPGPAPSVPSGHLPAPGIPATTAGISSRPENAPPARMW